MRTVHLDKNSELLRAQFQAAGARRALGDRRAFADPVGARRAGQLREGDASVRRQRDLARPGRREDFQFALQVDQLAEHRGREEFAALLGRRAEGLALELAADPVGLVGVEPVRLRGHLLAEFVAELAALRFEGRQVRRRQWHEERLLPVVRQETVARVEIAQLVVRMDLFLGELRPDEAERERRGLEHRVAGRVAPDRSGRGPRHAPLDPRRQRLLDGRAGLLFDERHEFVARLKLVRGDGGRHGKLLWEIGARNQGTGIRK